MQPAGPHGLAGPVTRVPPPLLCPSEPRRKASLLQTKPFGLCSTLTTVMEAGPPFQVSPLRWRAWGSLRGGAQPHTWMFAALAFSAYWVPGTLLKGRRRCGWSRRKIEGQIMLLTGARVCEKWAKSPGRCR